MVEKDKPEGTTADGEVGCRCLLVTWKIGGPDLEKLHHILAERSGRASGVLGKVCVARSCISAARRPVSDLSPALDDGDDWLLGIVLLGLPAETANFFPVPCW